MKCQKPFGLVSSHAPFQILGVIPARWASARFPGKPLHRIAGKPLIQHVWERCAEASELQRVVVATDDARIAEAVDAFGGEAVLTDSHHASGTDRVAEAAAKTGEYSHVINVQGDEPLISPGLIDALAAKMRRNPAIDMITAANPIHDESEFLDPNVVKVVIDAAGAALYFSRSAIPFARNESALPRYRHNGIYGFSTPFLQQFVQWKPSPLEIAEALEQLRALENGARIHVVVTGDVALGVDTPAQAREIEILIEQA